MSKMWCVGVRAERGCGRWLKLKGNKHKQTGKREAKKGRIMNVFTRVGELLRLEGEARNKGTHREG